MTEHPTTSQAASDRLDPDELRTLFLFEALDDDKLAWLSANGRVVEYASGSAIVTEGEPATCFVVLLDGTVTLSRRVDDVDVEVNRTNQRGVYGGATQAYLRTEEERPYTGTMLAITDCMVFEIPADAFAVVVREWFPMAMHLLEGLFVGMRSSQAIVGQRERLLSLGRLSAGLTHELNNPAAGAVRATAALRERVTKMRHKLAKLADGHVEPDVLDALTDLQEEAVEMLSKAPKLTPMQASDAEDALGDWMDDHDIDGGWDLASTLVSAGVQPAWLDRLAGALPPDVLADGLRWVTYALETDMLMGEIEDATHRISALVGAAKQYSQMDRAAHQDIDVTDGINSTLVMLGAKITKHGGIRVVKEYDHTLPTIPAHPAELNQVWTNLIDNAVGAMPDGGTLTIRTRRDRENVLVEVGDTGTGIASENLQRIFEPFFTTKPVGEGTGLGLDISYRIVTQRHHGDLSVESEPGRTTFRVRLPIAAPPADMV